MLFVSYAIAIEIPPEWREVIHNLCSEASTPPCSVQIGYGRHDRMQVIVDSQIVEMCTYVYSIIRFCSSLLFQCFCGHHLNSIPIL